MGGWRTTWRRIGGRLRWRDPSPRERLLKVNVRSADQKRRSSRRRSAAVAAVVGLLALAGIGWWTTLQIGAALFSENPRFTLRHLEIQASGPVITREHVREYAVQFGLMEGVNLFAVDIGRIREEFMRAVPSLKTMAIARVLPDTVAVEVSERLPIARLGRWKPMGIDREGYVYHLRSGARELPQIAGYFDKELRPGTRAQGMILSAIELLDVCNMTQFEYPIRVESIDISSGEYLDVRLIGGERIRLTWEGMEAATPDARESLIAKLARLARALKSAATRGKRIAQLDLTFGDQYVPAQEY